jgi:hypothetical protein
MGPIYPLFHKHLVVFFMDLNVSHEDEHFVNKNALKLNQKKEISKFGVWHLSLFRLSLSMMPKDMELGVV